MNLKSRKTLFLSLGLAGTFLLCAGLTNSAAVYAQSWRSQCPTSPQEWQRREAILRSRGWDGRLNNNGNVDLNRNGIDDRCEVGLFQGDRFEYDRYGNRNYRNDPYNSPYNRGNENYGYSSEVQRGYRDGLLKGREDALNNYRPDPNSSFRYRNGGDAYREGFRRGFFQAYRQYRGYGNS